MPFCLGTFEYYYILDVFYSVFRAIQHSTVQESMHYTELFVMSTGRKKIGLPFRTALIVIRIYPFLSESFRVLSARCVPRRPWHRQCHRYGGSRTIGCDLADTLRTVRTVLVVDVDEHCLKVIGCFPDHRGSVVGEVRVVAYAVLIQDHAFI